MVMRTGMSRAPSDGRFAVLPPMEHLRQSIMDIVSTPVGTRVMRPEYGSAVPRLVDQPVTKGWKLAVYAAVAEALHRWEPRVRVDRVRVDAVGPGVVELAVLYRLTDADAGVNEVNEVKVNVGGAG